MGTKSDRLVRGIQRRLQASQRFGPADLPVPLEVAELERRVRRLRAWGAQFSHVELSLDVAGGSPVALAGRVGGECVATEV